MTKTRHSGRMFGRKTARKRPKRDRIGITATGLGLEQDPRTAVCSIRLRGTVRVYGTSYMYSDWEICFLPTRCDLKNHRQPSEKSILQTVCDFCDDVIFAKISVQFYWYVLLHWKSPTLYILYTFSVYVPLPRLDEPPPVLYNCTLSFIHVHVLAMAWLLRQLVVRLAITIVVLSYGGWFSYCILYSQPCHTWRSS
jgi:hypothetical protein